MNIMTIKLIKTPDCTPHLDYIMYLQYHLAPVRPCCRNSYSRVAPHAARNNNKNMRIQIRWKNITPIDSFSFCWTFSKLFLENEKCYSASKISGMVCKNNYCFTA